MNPSDPSTEVQAFLERVMRYQDGALNAEEIAALERDMRESPDRRKLFTDAALRSLAIHEHLRREAYQPKPPVTHLRWSRWRPLTAAAAGLIFGLFSASMLWAYVGPYASRAVTVLQESFESDPPPRVTGVPVKPGQWSGDYSEVVGEQQGVKPTGGMKMLRFLRGDYEGKPKPEGSYISDLYQLVDLRSYGHEISDGGAMVQLTAKINAFSFPKEERYDCSLGIYALSAEMVADGTPHNDIALTNSSLAMGRKSLPNMDRDPRTWQKLDGELRLPSGTEFLLIRIGMLHGGKDQRQITFEGHFLDEVRLTLARRPPLP